jgi:hypothetical protein
VAEPELQVWMKQNNVVRGTTTPDGFRQLISDEIRKLSQIAVKAGISVD